MIRNIVVALFAYNAICTVIALVILGIYLFIHRKDR